MPRRGKGKTSLAPIKDILNDLELNKGEGVRFKKLTFDFLTKKKGLGVDDIIRLSDTEFYNLARELLRTETTPGKGQTGSQYWPADDEFRRSLTYVSNPSKMIRSVSDIMRNQRKNLRSARNKERRQNPSIFEDHDSATEPGPSSTPGVGLQTDLEPGISEREASREASEEASELESIADILSAPRERPLAPNPSDPTDPPSSLATPPFTPAVSSRMVQRRAFHPDSPRPSLEVASNSNSPAVQNLPAQEHFGSAINFYSRRRERSPTAFAEYNPRLPTNRDGSLDESSIKAWGDGVQFVKDRMEKFNRGLRRDHRTHVKLTPEDQQAALHIYYKSVGLDEFQEFLDSDLREQRRRLSEFKASRAGLGTSEERGLSRTLSP